jgi:hypothetical protein
MICFLIYKKYILKVTKLLSAIFILHQKYNLSVSPSLYKPCGLNKLEIFSNTGARQGKSSLRCLKRTRVCACREEKNTTTPKKFNKEKKIKKI